MKNEVKNEFEMLEMNITFKSFVRHVEFIPLQFIKVLLVVAVILHPREMKCTLFG